MSQPHYPWNRETDEIRATSDVNEWAHFFNQQYHRTVAQTNFPWPDEEHRLLISTVFLGLDHNFTRDGPPILFETMVFLDGEEVSDLTMRYCTSTEARAGHDEIVAFIQGVRSAGKELTEAINE
jgi:hypothetical protein